MWNACWSHVEQKRTLLRFRQAIANANDERTRIDDRSDDREPRFFVRQLLVDVDPAAVMIAWKLQDDRLAFGFEAMRWGRPSMNCESVARVGRERCAATGRRGRRVGV